jgi:hypothetical protein
MKRKEESENRHWNDNERKNMEPRKKRLNTSDMSTTPTPAPITPTKTTLLSPSLSASPPLQLLELPVELLLHIFSHIVPITDYFQLSRVCKDLNDLVNTPNTSLYLLMFWFGNPGGKVLGLRGEEEEEEEQEEHPKLRLKKIVREWTSLFGREFPLFTSQIKNNYPAELTGGYGQIPAISAAMSAKEGSSKNEEG